MTTIKYLRAAPVLAGTPGLGRIRLSRMLMLSAAGGMTTGPPRAHDGMTSAFSQSIRDVPECETMDGCAPS